VTAVFFQVKMSESTEAILAAFRETGAYLNGHFRLTSGLHSPEYLQCAKVLQYPQHAGSFGEKIRAAFPSLEVDLVCSPAMGGLIIGHEVARAFGVRHIFTERDTDGKMTLRRGFAVTPGERVLIVEDVITTGGSTREVVELLNSLGAKVAAAASIIDRSAGKADVGVPRVALATLEVTAWDPATCPLCAQGLPVVKPGSRPT
jgi:orotate phosphoribosyltransferase